VLRTRDVVVVLGDPREEAPEARIVTWAGELRADPRAPAPDLVEDCADRSAMLS